MNQRSVKLLAILLLAAVARTASAAQYRIYFVGSEARAIQSAAAVRPAGYVGLPPAAEPGNLSQPAPRKDPYHGAGTPNQIVTFLHPFTNQAITVPLTLPVGRPRVVIRSDRVIYDYGLFSHKVIVKFLRNGLVEVIYRG